MERSGTLDPTRWLRLLGLLAIGALLAACIDGSEPSTSEQRRPDQTPPSTSSGDDADPPGGAGSAGDPDPREPRDDAGPSEADESEAMPDEVVLAWTRVELPGGYAEAVAADDAVAVSTVVRGATAELVATTDADGNSVDEAEDGWHYPVEVLTVAPERYDRVLDGEVAGGLGPDEALLSESSAEVRELQAGARLEFADGQRLEVVEVVPDELVGAGEVIVAADSPLAADTEKYLLARPDGDRDALVDALERHVPGDTPARVHTVEDTPVLRHADAVLPPAQLKADYGEFAVRPGSEGRGLGQDEDWFEANIVAREVPILGEVTCHRGIIGPLSDALGELEQRDLADLVDPDDYAGCWNARSQAGASVLSHHAWGVAFDLNAGANPQGGESTQDPRLVETLADHGFTWGGDWLLPDPMHFEPAPS